MRLPLPVVGPAYSDNTKPISDQEAINYYLEQVETEGPRAKLVLKGTPGLLAFSNIGSSSIRGGHVAAEVPFVVSGTSLYRLDSAGGATSLGTVSGSARVDMADNRVAGGNQVVVVNGSLGYYYDTSSSTFAQITDPQFPAADVVDFLDNYLIVNVTGTAKYQYSALADATNWDALDFVTKESKTDNLVTLKVNHGLLHLFGSRSTEVHRHTGDATFPFERIDGATFDIGCASKFGRTALNDRLYFLGHDGKAYQINGYVPQRISSHAIEQAFRNETLSECFCFSYSDRGHDFIGFSFPSGKTWVYDAVLGASLGPQLAWHRRKSYDVDRWRINTTFYAFGKQLAGDGVTGRVWELDADTFLEGTDPLVAERKTAYSHKDQNALIWDELELVMDTGNGLNTGQGSSPVVEMCFSDDGGRNWSNWRPASVGATGEYGTRVRFTRMGRSRSRLFHFRISDPVRRDILAATATIEDQGA